jgi:hypothetical protein
LAADGQAIVLGDELAQCGTQSPKVVHGWLFVNFRKSADWGIAADAVSLRVSQQLPDIVWHLID